MHVRHNRKAPVTSTTPDVKDFLRSAFVMAAGITYLFIPFDLVPDQIPYCGYLDDTMVMALSIAYAWRLAPSLPVIGHSIRRGSHRSEAARDASQQITSRRRWTRKLATLFGLLALGVWIVLPLMPLTVLLLWALGIYSQ